MKRKEEPFTIIKINGSDQRLHRLIGPLVTNPEVLACNDNYPFKNTDDHVWYIALKQNRTVAGFLSLKKSTISNDFVHNDLDLLELLIEKALSDLPKGIIVRFLAGKEELPLMEQLGFQISKEGVKYYRMFKKTE
jgi:hypothetical protein